MSTAPTIMATALNIPLAIVLEFIDQPLKTYSIIFDPI